MTEHLTLVALVGGSEVAGGGTSVEEARAHVESCERCQELVALAVAARDSLTAGEAPVQGAHLSADDLGDLSSHSLAQWKHGIGAGSQLADKAAPDQQLVADRLGIGRIFSKCGDESL